MDIAFGGLVCHGVKKPGEERAEKGEVAAGNSNADFHVSPHASIDLGD